MPTARKPTTSKTAATASIVVRQARTKDIPGMVEVARAAYSAWPAHHLAGARHYRLQLQAFPEGQFVAEADGVVVGYAASLIVQLDDESPWYNHAEITGDGTFSTHDPSGDTLYGSDICVHPDWQGRGISRLLYRSRISLLPRYNLRQMIAGGRIPGYAAHRGRLSAEEYVAGVVAGRIKDQALNAHLAAGYTVAGVHYGYLADEQSLGYATHLVMPNTRHQARRRMVAGAPLRSPARRLRVCTVQYDQRTIDSWKDFAEQIGHHVTTADTYDTHLLVLPEYVTAQMFSTFKPGTRIRPAIRRLTGMAKRIDALFLRHAERTGMHIVGGTMPRLVDGQLRNVATLYTPSGGMFRQEKLHITPAEREEWGIQPGEGLRVFNTPIGRIAILVCYDIEFPELSRLLVDAGVDVIVVPSATDERKSYLRVRYCAAARAVENMAYVVLAANVGQLRRSPAMQMNFGQAAILSPSDFAFPLNGIVAEGVINTPAMVIGDLDLGALEVQRRTASVRPLMDRRLDLYGVAGSLTAERVHTGRHGVVS
jgi:predicted amidohydrolase/GNAT superfamily N-acetyltransferase